MNYKRGKMSRERKTTSCVEKIGKESVMEFFWEPKPRRSLSVEIGGLF